MAKFAKILKAGIKNFLRRSVTIIIIVILLCLLFVALGGYSHNDQFKIKKITVIGASTVSEDAIREFVTSKLQGNYYFVYARDNSFIFPQKEIRDGLLQTFVRLASVETVRIDNNTIAVEVTERVPFAIWCGNTFADGATDDLSNCYYVDQSGIIFAHAPTFSPGVYMEFYSPLDGAQGDNVLGARIPTDSFTTSSAIADSFQNSIGKLIRIVIKPGDEYSAIIGSSDSYPILNGVEIRFMGDLGADTIVNNLLASLPVQFPPDQTSKKKLLYIDMRFAKNVVFGFEHASTTTKQ